MTRTAFSLLELMIVLAILAGLLVLAGPALRRPLARSDVQQAADQFAQSLRSARMAAIDAGEIYQVQYHAENSAYWHGPASELSDLVKAFGDTNSVQIRSTSSKKSDAADPQFGSRQSHQRHGRNRTDPRNNFADKPAQADRVSERSLQHGILFGPSSHSRQKQYPESASISSRFDSEAGAKTIFFFPDGRSSGGNVPLLSPDGYQVTIDVRMLTAGVTIGLVERVDVTRRDHDFASRTSHGLNESVLP